MIFTKSPSFYNPARFFRPFSWMLGKYPKNSFPSVAKSCPVLPSSTLVCKYSTVRPSKFVAFTQGNFPASFNYYKSQSGKTYEALYKGTFFELYSKDVFDQFRLGALRFSEITHTGKSHDGGIDLVGILHFQNQKYVALFQCKCQKKKTRSAVLKSSLGGKPMNSFGNSVFVLVSTSELGFDATNIFKRSNVPIINVVLRNPLTPENAVQKLVDTNVLKFELNRSATVALGVKQDPILLV